MEKRRLTEAFWDWPIGTKLNIFFVMLIVIPLSLFGVIVSTLIRGMQTDRIYSSSWQYLNQSMQGIESSLSELDNIVVSNLWNKELLQLLNKDNGYISSPKEKNLVTSILRSVANARKDIECLALTANSGENFVYSSDKVELSIYDWIEEVIAVLEESYKLEQKYERGETVWLGIPKNSGYVVGIRKIRDFETLEELGIFYLFLKEETVRQQYGNLKSTESSFFVVYDMLGQMISSSGAEMSELTDIRPGEGEQLNEGKMAGQKYYYNELLERDMGWTIQEFIPQKELMQDIRKIQLLITSIILIILGILFLLMNRFSQSLTEPIRNLQDKMREVRNENFDVEVQVEHKDELGELAVSFNKMASRIKHLIEEDYKSKILLQETEYKFLRAQINPHFLYNTLDSISWMASLEGNKDVSKMSVALGRILRWSISNQENIVRLEEEIHNVEDYLSIQRIRYGECFHYLIAVDEPENKMQVPKMILQPLVENALIHGLEEKDGEKRLVVSAETNDRVLEIHIRDNGVGMTNERISEIMSGQVSQKTNHGVGLYNVHTRIQMICGKEYGVHIESARMEGTEITIVLPTQGGIEDDSSYDCRR